MLRTSMGVLLLIGATAVLSPPPDSALGCAAVGRRAARIEIAQENAIIIWDATTKTQHFIRRASFDTTDKDFGFLVPTPTKPELAESSDLAFSFLDRLTAPIIRSKGKGAAGGKGSSKGSKAPPVEVIETKRVAGYDAAVLAATSSEALNEWLKKNGYVSSPELMEWLKPYVAKRWKITAFKISPEGKESTTVATSAVRMSFKTERPFFPYREPQQKGDAEKTEGKNGREAQAGRLLRVYYLGRTPVKGTLGKKSDWPGRTVWSNRISTADRNKLVNYLKLPEQLPQGNWWLTKMEDRSSPRPGTEDVFFTSLANKSIK